MAEEAEIVAGVVTVRELQSAAELPAETRVSRAGRSATPAPLSGGEARRYETSGARALALIV